MKKLTEHYDSNALSYIIANFDQFPWRIGNKQDTLTMLKRYKAKSRDSSIEVLYAQKHNRGRYFAKSGLSMQNMAREIRNAIGWKFYDEHGTTCDMNIPHENKKFKGDCTIITMHENGGHHNTRIVF